ncbi:MAG: SDR family oxidoreductase [Archangium sp.]|nr:SDR family oxidoreductase [Archangium sp.]
MSELKGKTVLVTGATAGIGLETALGIAKLGAHLVIVGRNAQKTKRVCDELKATSGNQQLEFLLADLSLLSGVRTLAEEFLGRTSKLHVLINNVGAINLKREVTAEGLELTFAMNHLGPFLLTKLLLPALEKAAPSRIVNVSSDAHRSVGLDFDDLQSERSYSSFGAYARSKLMNILFTRELARRVASKRITANALHPGMVASDFINKPGAFGKVANAFVSVFGISPEKGARTSIFLAASPEVEGLTGRYFTKSKAVLPSRRAQDDEAAKRLWELSESLTR